MVQVNLLDAEEVSGKGTLFPHCFVDLLQSVINDAASKDDSKHPLGDSFGGDYLVVQYVDDTLLIMLAGPNQLLKLKDNVHVLAISIGLKVNFNKCFLVSINVDDSMVSALANCFRCNVGEMTLTYLGLPLGSTRPAIKIFLPILNRMENISWESIGFCHMLEDLFW